MPILCVLPLAHLPEGFISCTRKRIGYWKKFFAVSVRLSNFACSDYIEKFFKRIYSFCCLVHLHHVPTYLCFIHVHTSHAPTYLRHVPTSHPPTHLHYVPTSDATTYLRHVPTSHAPTYLRHVPTSHPATYLRHVLTSHVPYLTTSTKIVYVIELFSLKDNWETI